MRLDRMRRSSNVEDRRGFGGRRVVVGGGMGLGGLVILLLYLAMGGNPQSLPQINVPMGAGGGGSATIDPSQQAQAEVVTRVLGDTEEVWGELFAQVQRRYQEPRLVLFTGGVESACGFAESAVGPFYCPADGQVYIDLEFFDELGRRFGAPGDFAQAYVVAHEVGHHVQNLLGTTSQVQSARGRMSQSEYNELSVRLELQADYFAGVWAHHAQKKRQILEPGDIEEGIRAASAVGDDRIQMRSRGYVVPDSFTHGTSAQRVKWFKLGYESGDLFAHDPFKEASP